MRERRVGAVEGNDDVWKFARGAAEMAELDEVLDEVVARVFERGRASPFVISAGRPLGVAVPSDEVLDEGTSDSTAVMVSSAGAALALRGVGGTTVCVDVVESDEDEDEDGVGECERGGGVGEGEGGVAGFVDASVSA